MGDQHGATTRSLQEAGHRALEALVDGLEPVESAEIAAENLDTLHGALVRRLLDDFARANEHEPEALGSVYEGTLGFALELAREPVSVIEVPRKAGQARLELAVPLDSELRAGSVAERFVPEGRYFLRRTGDRRQSGSHYTSRALAERVVEATLAPLLAERRSPDDILALRVCDPAVGSGAFLVAACRVLAKRLASAWGNADSEAALARARAGVAAACLFGTDRDPLAIETAKRALASCVGETSVPGVGRNLVVADALVSDFSELFPNVTRSGGFHAFVGNPPWVSYAGRAAQPLAPELRAAYTGRYRAFFGYRNLQGLFVERAAALLAPGGRLGLLLPSSMSELEGYAATRRAHDRFCIPDEELPDIGEGGFEGVFQPCMILLSTRRAAPLEDAPSEVWKLERPDLDISARALLTKLNRTPLPAGLFGERGLQSSGADLSHLARSPDERHSVALRCGSDIEPFRLGSPSYFADPEWFGGRLRAPDAWKSVRFIVRQTARVPMAALSDGAGFRNSLLAGFEDAAYPAAFLVAYLNSSPIRWLHYMRHRDARNGMPQLKIMHLRSTPAPPDASLVAELERAGTELSSRNRGIESGEQAAIDRRVAEAFALEEPEWEKVRGFAATLKP
ncbi:MAG TPA: N-6 DNA methylase [Polyangiaceae bacterium]